MAKPSMRARGRRKIAPGSGVWRGENRGVRNGKERGDGERMTKRDVKIFPCSAEG